MPEIDHNEAALNDIAAKPEVSNKAGESEHKRALMPVESEHKQENDVHVDIDFQELERSAGRFVSKTFDKIQGELGGEKDDDFSVLLAETLGGVFSGVRMLSGRPWVSLMIAVGAVSTAAIPPFIGFMKKKRAEEEKSKVNK